MGICETYSLINSLATLLINADDVCVEDDQIYEWQCQLQEALLSVKTPSAAPTKLQALKGQIRFCLPHQLDRTQWEDVFDRDAWNEYYENATSNLHGSKYPSNEYALSYSRDLSPEVCGRRVCATRTSPFGIIPEISNNGARRCVYVAPNGRRCRSYTHHGVLCRTHVRFTNVLKGYLMTHGGEYGGMFKNETLQEMYQSFLSSDARDITSEIAVMRTMLASLLKQLPQEGEKLPVEVLNYVVKLTTQVTSSIEKYDRMQQRLGLLVTPEQLNRLLFQMLSIIKETLNLRAEQYVLLAERMSAVTIERQDAGLLAFGSTMANGYGEKEETALPVKFSNTCTRYRDDGEVRQVPIEAEIAYHDEQQEYLAQRGAEKRTKYHKEGDYLPHTTVGSRKVAIGDERDPYDYR